MKAIKFNEILKKSETELVKDLSDLRDSLSSLRLKSRLSELKTVHQVKVVRANIARTLTALNRLRD